MSLEAYLHAVPKVELNLELEGAIPRDTLLMLAEQNDIASTMKKREYDQLVRQLQEPTPETIEDTTRITAGWLQHPEDLARIVYDVGVGLSKQKVRYAEISIQPAIWTDLNIPFDVLLEALNDGRDRVERAWKVKINWILAIPRSRPRKADDIARWATSASARKGNVVGLALTGREDSQPIGQFKKAFMTATRKELPAVAHAQSSPDAETIPLTVAELGVQRITDSWGLLEDAETLDYLSASRMPLVVSPQREVFLGRIGSMEDYPVRQLLDENVNLLLGSGMPELYGATLQDVYLMIASSAELSFDEVDRMIIDSLNASFAIEEEKEALLAEITESLKQARLQSVPDTE